MNQPKSRTAMRDEAAEKYAAQFEGCGPTDVGRRYRSFKYGWDARDKLDDEALKIAVEALEDCTGGDLASGDGIYKAEIAREALQKLRKEIGE